MFWSGRTQKSRARSKQSFRQYGARMTGPTEGGPQRPHRFDAFGLSARRGEIAGSIDAYELDRVADRLGDEDGIVPPAAIEYRIVGDTDALGRAVLKMDLDGAVPLECQRCLRVFEWPVAHRTSLVLARDEQELAYLDDNDEREVLLANAPLDPLGLVEDELLLSLPYVPRCDRPDCVTADAASIDEATSAPSVFERLTTLKGGTEPPSE